MKLNVKILLLIIPMLVVPITGIGWIAYQQINENAYKNSITHVTTVLDDIFESNTLFKSNTASNLSLFSSDDLIQKYLTTDEETRYTLLLPTLLRLFATYQQAYPHYYEIRILLPDGYEDARRVNRDINNITDDESQSPLFQNLQTTNKKTQQYAFNPDNHEFSFYSSEPIIIKDRANDSLSDPPILRGYLSITASINWLSEKINNAPLGQKAIIFIADNQGTVITTQSLQENINVGNTLTELFEFNSDKASLKNNFTTPLGGLEKTNTKLIAINEAGYLWHKPFSENLVLFAWQPNKEILASSRKLGSIIILISLVSVILMTILIYRLLAYFIIQPIQDLETATQAIGRGDLTEKINIKRDDEIGSLASSFNKMSDNLLRSNEQIKYLAYHDDLTGLPNRLMFMEYVSQAIASAQRNNHKLAILYLDLDNFKRVNDTLGHKAGDSLLKEISNRVLDCLRETDYVSRMDNELSDITARIGGDEFLLLLHNIPDNYLPGKIAQRILDTLATPVTLNNIEFYVSASIGITIYPDDSQDTDNLIKHADIAMYHAKNNGKNNYQYFLSSMNNSMLERISLENKLRLAVQENHLFLQYQPQVDTFTGEIIGVEALVRWQDPDTGIIPPNKFIPVAEETGLIIDIGKWVLLTACKQAYDWQQQGFKPIRMSVNFSAIQFTKVDVPALIVECLTESQLDAKYLDVEITETVIMEDITRVSQVLNEIREIGAGISLDDFGTGYSSLNYLRQFPIDILKIDRSFVSEIIHQSENKYAIITAIIAMSHALDLKVIAEGIETEAQLNKLKEWKCDYIQGFYLHRPMNADKLEDLLTPMTTLADQ